MGIDKAAGMGFEQPVKNPWENKKSPAFKDWLFRNASKSPQERDKNFQEYVDIRLADWKKRTEAMGGSSERTGREVFNGYLRRMDIDEDYIKGKRILDLGCREGSFVCTCLDQSLTQDVYGMDVKLLGEAATEKYSGHFFEGDFRSTIPVQQLDSILFKASLHMLLRDKNGVEQATTTLLKAIDALSPSGEIRIGPITERLIGRYPDDQVAIHQMLEKLVQSRVIRYEFIPVDIGAWERKDAVDAQEERVVVFESVLVIRHAD